MVLADLFTKGFGISKSDEDDGSKADKSKDAKGRSGMGEGEGEKDVSDQIEDEDQLLDTDKKDTSSRELRAKDDGVDTADEPEESSNSDKPEEGNNENVDKDNFGVSENLEDKIQNKEEALADAPGLTPDVGNEQIGDDMEIDERDEAKKEDADQPEETCPEDQKHPEEGENDQETQEPAEETMKDRAEDVCESPQKEDPGIDLEQKSETEPMEGKEPLTEDMTPNFCNDNISGGDSGSQNPHGSNGLGAGSKAPQENLSASNVSDELTDSMDPSGSNTEMNFTMTNLANGETLTDNIAKMEFPQNQS